MEDVVEARKGYIYCDFYVTENWFYCLAFQFFLLVVFHVIFTDVFFYSFVVLLDFA